MVLAIALNFCLLHAIGLGAIDAAVRLRSCDRALASRIGARSLALSIHLFTSRRAERSRKLMYDRGGIPLIPGAVPRVVSRGVALTCAAAEVYDDLVQALAAGAAQSLLARAPVAP
jgi:hypothetical protein